MPAAHAFRRIEGAVADIGDGHLAVARRKFGIGPERAAKAACAFAVGDEPPLVDKDRMAQLVDLDRVLVAHASIADVHDRQPAVGGRRAGAAGAAEIDLVDEGMAVVDARDDAGGGGNARARLRDAEPVRQLGQGALNGVGDTIGEIGGGNRAGGRMERAARRRSLR